MKKNILMGLSSLISAGLLISCAPAAASSSFVLPPVETVSEPDVSMDELIKLAQAEGEVVVYSATSRIAAASTAFTAKYGIKVQHSNLKDGEMIEKVYREVSGGVQGADFVLIQDSGRIYGQLISTGTLVNYVPARLKSVIPEEFQEPLHFMLTNKVFIYNSERSQNPVIQNVWELTEPNWRGLMQFKDPNQEGVNFNFLTMITSPEWSKKLADAYYDRYGRDIVLTTENAGYEWIKLWFNNGLILGNSDTTISENIGIKGQNNTTLGLFVYSKKRFDASKNLALLPMEEVKPFAGFYYPIFAQMTSNAKNPNAAKLFIEFLLTEEGFKPWSKDVGGYSPNSTVPVNSDDKPLTYWVPRLVPEDPIYIFQNRAKVEEFVNRIK
jgi:iron(III) transport system substrate-binding protein